MKLKINSFPQKDFSSAVWIVATFPAFQTDKTGKMPSLRHEPGREKKARACPVLYE